MPQTATIEQLIETLRGLGQAGQTDDLNIEANVIGEPPPDPMQELLRQRFMKTPEQAAKERMAQYWQEKMGVAEGQNPKWHQYLLGGLRAVPDMLREGDLMKLAREKKVPYIPREERFRAEALEEQKALGPLLQRESAALEATNRARANARIAYQKHVEAQQLKKQLGERDLTNKELRAQIEAIGKAGNLALGTAGLEQRQPLITAQTELTKEKTQALLEDRFFMGLDDESWRNAVAQVKSDPEFAGINPLDVSDSRTARFHKKVQEIAGEYRKKFMQQPYPLIRQIPGVTGRGEAQWAVLDRATGQMLGVTIGPRSISNQQAAGMESGRTAIAELRGMLKMAKENPDALKKTNVVGRDALAWFNRLDPKTQAILTQNIRAKSAFIKQMSGLQVNENEDRRLTETFPKIWFDGPQFIYTALNILALNEAAMARTELGLSPDDLDLSSVITDMHNKLGAAIKSGNLNNYVIPSRDEIIVRAAWAAGKKVHRGTRKIMGTNGQLFDSPDEIIAVTQ